MSQSEFWRVIIITVSIGTAIAVIGAGLLFLAFRSFGTARRGEVTPVILMIATLGVVFLFCVGLLIWSIR